MRGRGLLVPLLLGLAACASEAPSPDPGQHASPPAAQGQPGDPIAPATPPSQPSGEERTGDARLLGLLAVPSLFGEGPCLPFHPEEVALHPAPASPEPTGWIRVDRNWTFPEMGGCEGLSVNVHPVGGGPPYPVPTREFGYETPGLVVVGRQEEWFQLSLEDGTAWVKAHEGAEFHPLTELLDGSLAFLTPLWDGRLAAYPGEAAGEEGTQADPVEPGGEVRVLGFHQEGEQLWVRVERLAHSICDGWEEPQVVETGWVPAHGRGGDPVVWFHSRGC